MLAVSDMVDHDCRVVFDKDEYGTDISQIVNKKTGKTTPLIRKGGTYDMKMVVLPYSKAKQLMQSISRCAKGTCCPNERLAKR